MTAPVEIETAGFEALVWAAALSRQGVRVTVRDAALRAGGELVTQSFLTPFRFNLGGGLVHRAAAGGLPVVEPDALLQVGDSLLEPVAVELAPHATVRATLDANAQLGTEQRALLCALAVFLGLDPDAEGSGAALAWAAGKLDQLILVAGGNGLVPAALIDEIVANGGNVIEGTGGWTQPPSSDASLGTCRLFVGFRGARPPSTAFATAAGFHDEESLWARLNELREGAAAAPVGFLLSNAHLDPRRDGDELGSIVWQGVLPAAATSVTRADYVDAVLAAGGIDGNDVVFSLLWLPSDTQEPLGADLTFAIRPEDGDTVAFNRD